MMTVESEAIRELFLSKMMETCSDLSERKFDSLAMIEALGAAFLSLAAGCAPSHAEYERVTGGILAFARSFGAALTRISVRAAAGKVDCSPRSTPDGARLLRWRAPFFRHCRELPDGPACPRLRRVPP